MPINYQYIFSDITNGWSNVQIKDFINKRNYSVQAKINDNGYIPTYKGSLNPIQADFVDLMLAIFVSDWLLKRKLDQKMNIKVCLPLRNPSTFERYSKSLQELLTWYTGDSWIFDFQHRQADSRKAQTQSKLPFPQGFQEIALWSGGLDSYAGLCNRVRSTDIPAFTLVGSGSNTKVLGKQKTIHKEMSKNFRGQKEFQLIQVPIQLRYSNSKNVPQNQLFRARGLVFKLCDAICAMLQSQSTVHIYENGYGAFNLPFISSDLGSAHTRSVHPRSLIKTGEFITNVSGQKLSFVNPFLFTTKAEMCKVTKAFPNSVMLTETCDSPRRHEFKECGYCSSCLLRRMALSINFDSDETGYFIEHESVLGNNHFQAMNMQAERLKKVLDLDDSWRHWLNEYPKFKTWSSEIANSLGISNRETERKIMRLYRKHTLEWMDVREEIRPSNVSFKGEKRL